MNLENDLKKIKAVLLYLALLCWVAALVEPWFLMPAGGGITGFEVIFLGLGFKKIAYVFLAVANLAFVHAAIVLSKGGSPDKSLNAMLVFSAALPISLGVSSQEVANGMDWGRGTLAWAATMLTIMTMHVMANFDISLLRRRFHMVFLGMSLGGIGYLFFTRA